MLKELAEYIVNKAEPKEMPLAGRLYTTKPVSPVESPMAKAIEVATLTGLVDYIKTNVDKLDMDALMVVVDNHAQVRLVSSLVGDFRQRETLMTVEADLLQMQFNSWIDAERFNIFLQACFVDDSATDRQKIIKFAGNVQESASVQTRDDGITQATEARTGLATLEKVNVPNPVNLRPFRTFPEIEQPASKFVFRARKGPEFMLVEADGGAWRNEARASIKQYLQEALNPAPEDDAEREDRPAIKILA